MSIGLNMHWVNIKRYTLLYGCTALSIILASILYIRSDLTEERRIEFKKYSEEGKRFSDNVRNAVQLQEQLDFMTKANEAVQARALPAKGLAENLQYFYRLESEVGIKYKELRSGSQTSAPKGSIYVPINYILSFDGTFPQIITYLRNLEQGAYFCRMTGVALSGHGPVISINITLDILGMP